MARVKLSAPLAPALRFSVLLAPARRIFASVLRFSAVLAAALFLYARAHAAPAPGTPIDNVSHATGTIPNGTLAAESNPVRTLVSGIEAATLARGQSASASAGSQVAFVHRLTNTGNAAASFRLDLANLAGDGFDGSALSLARDANGDGALDPGDPAIAPGTAIALASGDSADLIVSATVPLAAPNGSSAWVTIAATGLATGFTVSNTDTLRATPAQVAPTLAFYADGSYTATTRVSTVFSPLFVEAAAPQCDLDPARIDSVTITITSARTGDVETFRAAETGSATGRFRPVPNVPTFDVTPALIATHAGVVDLARNDEIVAELQGCGALRTEARVWIDPAGVVFDARGGQLVSGTTVRLIDVTGAGNGGVAGGAARVTLADGLTPAPSVITTGADGLYDFPLVAASTYRLEVTPPADRRFPSGVLPANLPAGHVIDAAGSYGADFGVPGTFAPVRWDLPLDAVPQVALFAQKTASRSVVEVGDELDYAVRIESRSDSALAAVALSDALPRGFAYVPGTARRDGAGLADPAGGRGPALNFAVGSLGAREAATVRYRVRVGPGALDGDGVNRAWASASGVRSNEASARVQLTGGVFADEATLLGTLWVDLDGDRRRGPGEPGMPGVRLYLDDGTFAITDRDGRFSLYGLDPRATAVKVDGATLPDVVKPAAVDRRDFGTPGVRLVDLHRGELQRADFALAPDSTQSGSDSAAVAIARQRASSPGLFGNEIARGLTRDLSSEGSGALAGDPRARPTSGVVTGESRLPLFALPASSLSPPEAAARRETRGGVPAAAAAVPAAGADAGVTATLATSAPLEQIAATSDPDLGFLGLSDLDTVAVDQIAVRVKGRIGVPLRLRVNGQFIPEARVGRRVIARASGVEVWEYLGIELEPGVNLLEVAPPRSVGRIALRLVAPGPLARIELAPPRSAIADGHTSAALRLRAVDQDGVPVGARTLVTLESSLGQFAGPDLDPAAPGFQTAVEGGEIAVAIVSPASPGRARITAASGALRAATSIDFVPDLRPLFAVGSFEGVVAFGRASGGPNAASRPVTGFESRAEQFRSERRDGRASATGRGALFMKGRVMEQVLLTLGYDTDKPEGLRRFRDIQPDAFYPVYGDASVRGYEAQSTGRLYARIDRRGASLLYGDFITRSGGGARSLASYNRSLSGVQHHFEDERVRFDAFTSRERARRRVEELPGLGISGPYLLPGAPIVENSERVEIVTHDRNQPAVVLTASARARFTDYEIDPLAGRIVFKQPVPSFDPELNPVTVRVSYEVESGGDAFWVSGAEGRVRIGQRLEAGGSMVDDHDPEKPSELRSLSLAARLETGTLLEAEWAASRRLGGARGDAARFELRHESARVQARAFGSATGEAFDNPGAGFGPGRTEAGGRLQARLDERTQLRMEALYSSDARSRERRGGLLFALSRSLTRELQGEIGARVAGEERTTGFENPTSYALRARLTGQWPGRPGLSGYAEAEQSVLDQRRLAAIGAEYRMGTRGRLYMRHELVSSLSSAYALSEGQRRLASVAGVDANVATDAHVFSEYRLGGGISGREAEAALGLRNTWTVEGGMRIGASFERVSPLRGSSAGPVTAVTGSIEYADGEDWKGSSRWEVRTGRASDSFLSSMAAAARLSPAWTALARQIVTLSDEHANGSHARERLLAGFAYREPSREAWDALARYELRYDRDVPRAGDAHRRIANVVSAHGTGRVARGTMATFGWAGKRVTERADGLTSRSGAQWLLARGTFDVGRNWDLGLHGSTLLGRGFGTRRDGLGAEIGRQMGGGLWLSAGWNRFGYEDQDLTGDEYTRQGGFLRLRARFDDGAFHLQPRSRP